MSRIVIIVEGGMADYVNDTDVEVLTIDIDNINAGDDVPDISGFEDLVPQWVKDRYIED
jgi:hypothetical protein